LLYKNICNFAAWLLMLGLATLLFAGTGWFGGWLTGVHPSGRLYVTPFVFLEITTAIGAAIYAFRLAVSTQVGSAVIRDRRRMAAADGDTYEVAATLRQRHQRAYQLLMPRSADVILALACGAFAAAVAWQAS
jgi:hypothetical protein